MSKDQRGAPKSVHLLLSPPSYFGLPPPILHRVGAPSKLLPAKSVTDAGRCSISVIRPFKEGLGSDFETMLEAQSQDAF